MDPMDDCAGPMLWSIPPSDDEQRAMYIAELQEKISLLRQINPGNMAQAIGLIKKMNLPADVSSDNVEELIQTRDEGIEIMSGMIEAAMNGKPGQGILTVIYKDGILHGFMMNPETGETKNTSRDLSEVGIPEPLFDKILPAVITGAIHAWCVQTNSVPAWQAIRAMNTEIEFPDMDSVSMTDSGVVVSVEQ